MDFREQLDLMQRMLMLQTTLMLKEYLDKHGSSIQNSSPQCQSENSTGRILPLLPESEEDSDSSGHKSDSNSSGDNSSSNQDVEQTDEMDDTYSSSSSINLTVFETLPTPHSPDNPWGLRSLEGVHKVNRPEKISGSLAEKKQDLPMNHIHLKYPLCGDMKIALIGAHGTGKTSYMKALLKVHFEQSRYEPGDMGSQRFSIVVDFPGRYDENGTLKSIRRKRILLTIIDYPGQRNISVDKTVHGFLLFGTSDHVFPEMISNKFYQRVVSRCDLMTEKEIPNKLKLSRMKNPPIYISSVTHLNLLGPIEKMIESRFGKPYQIYHPVKVE